MFYAVRVGRIPGIYPTWNECQAQVKGFSKPVFRKFTTKCEAEEFINGGSSSKTGILSTTVNKKFGNSTGQMKKSNKRSYCTDSTQDEPQPKLKKSLTDASVNDNFTGVAFDDSEGVEVYTDGACFNNGQSGAVSGIGVFWGVKHKDNTSEPLDGRQTNNRAEIHAARKAIEQAKVKKIKNLILYTDSAFLINSITKWIKGWKRNGWILSSGKPVINKDDFQELDAVLKGINVKWVHVRGHCGIPGNEAADELANQGARKQMTS